MAQACTVTEYIPIFEGEQTIKEILTSLIVEKILSKSSENALPKEEQISYNVNSVPLIPEAPGLCNGVS